MAKIYAEEVSIANQLEGTIKLQNDQYLKWRNAANSADVDVFKLDTSNNTILSGHWSIASDGTFSAFAGARNFSTSGGSVTAGAFFGSSIDVSGNSEANQFLINGSVAIDSSNGFVGSGGVSTVGLINTNDRYRIDGVDVINTSGTFVGSGGVSTVGLINTNDRYRIDSVDVIDTGRRFVGSGGVNTSGGVQGSSGTFPTVNTGLVTNTTWVDIKSTNSTTGIAFYTGGDNPRWRFEPDGTLRARIAARNIDTLGGSIIAGQVSSGTTLTLDGNTGINFEYNNSVQWTLNSGGALEPISDNTKDIGSNSKNVRTLHTREIHSGAASSDGDRIKLAGYRSAIYIGQDTGTDVHGIVLTTNDDISFRLDAIECWRIATNYHFLPGADSTFNMGATSLRMANVYADAFPAFSGVHLYKINETTPPSAGDAVYLDSNNELLACTAANDQKCIGILTGAYDETNEDVPTVVDSLGNIYTRETSPSVVEKKVYNVVSVGDPMTGGLTGAKVCDEGGAVNDGDLLVTSSTTGFLMKQSDDIVRAKTVAQARRDVTFDGNGEATGVYVYLLK